MPREHACTSTASGGSNTTLPGLRGGEQSASAAQSVKTAAEKPKQVGTPAKRAPVACGEKSRAAAANRRVEGGYTLPDSLSSNTSKKTHKQLKDLARGQLSDELDLEQGLVARIPSRSCAIRQFLLQCPHTSHPDTCKRHISVEKNSAGAVGIEELAAFLEDDTTIVRECALTACQAGGAASLAGDAAQQYDPRARHCGERDRRRRRECDLWRAGPAQLGAEVCGSRAT